MGKLYDALDDRLTAFIGRQRLFFVATAPREGGHVNLSPKGLDSFRVISPTVVAYQDLIGSGAETIAHLGENGRITIMFCAFEGPPLILRLYGRGEVLVPGHADYAACAGRFAERLAMRSVIRVALTRIADSCGFGVPTYTYVHERRQLGAWAESKGPDGLAAYQRENNRQSIDGLPALTAAE